MLRRRRIKLSMKPLMNRSNNQRVNINHTKMKKGDEGDDVKKIQEMLVDITFFYPSIPDIKVDGIYGENTQKAVKRFQELMGIYDTGDLDQITLNKLNLIHSKRKAIKENSRTEEKVTDDIKFNNTLKQGSKGKEVIELQEYINKVSNLFPAIPKVTIDGLFGAKTKEAVVTFQRMFNLKTDGIVGEITWTALYNASLGKIMSSN